MPNFLCQFDAHSYKNSIDVMNNNSSNGSNNNNNNNNNNSENGSICGVCIENSGFPKQPLHSKYTMTRNELLKFFAKILQKNKRSTNANKNRFSKHFGKHQRLRTPQASLQSIGSYQYG